MKVPTKIAQNSAAHFLTSSGLNGPNDTIAFPYHYLPERVFKRLFMDPGGVVDESFPWQSTHPGSCHENLNKILHDALGKRSIPREFRKRWMRSVQIGKTRLSIRTEEKTGDLILISLGYNQLATVSPNNIIQFTAHLGDIFNGRYRFPAIWDVFPFTIPHQVDDDVYMVHNKVLRRELRAMKVNSLCSHKNRAKNDFNNHIKANIPKYYPGIKFDLERGTCLNPDGCVIDKWKRKEWELLVSNYKAGAAIRHKLGMFQDGKMGSYFGNVDLVTRLYHAIRDQDFTKDTSLLVFHLYRAVTRGDKAHIPVPDEYPMRCFNYLCKKYDTYFKIKFGAITYCPEITINK